MKRVKYTNTKIDALRVIRTNPDTVIITDDSLLRIKIRKISNKSKNQKPVCYVYYLNNFFYKVEKTSSQILTIISNAYLYWSLHYTNKKLCNKLFTQEPFIENIHLYLYVSDCALYKYYRGVKYEKTI
nr:MAG TPA: hypothetical protein [Caudoviricetes sp.]